MKQKLLPTLLFGVTLLYTSCSTLTKSQLAEINTYGQLTEKYAGYPGKFVLSINSVRMKQELLSANSQLSAGDHFDKIKEAYDHKKANDKLGPKADLSFKIINKYAQALILLSSDQHQKTVDTAVNNFGTSLDGLIEKYNTINSSDPLPKGIGATVSELLMFGAKQYVKSQQAKKIKIFVNDADPMITKLTNNILVQLDGGLKASGGATFTFTNLIGRLRNDLRGNYIDFLGDRITTINKSTKPGKQEVTAYINYTPATLDDDKECVQLLSDLDHLDVMLAELKAATVNIAKAHKKLLTEINSPRSLKENAEEIQMLGDNINSIKNSIQNIKK